MNQSKEVELQNIDGNIAGGSFGSLIILMAQSIPENSVISKLLIYSSPFIGVGISVFWKWIKVEIDKNLKDRQFRKYIGDCKEFIQISLSDVNLSKERKNELKQQYDRLNELSLKVHVDKIKSIEFDDEFESIIILGEKIAGRK